MITFRNWGHDDESSHDSGLYPCLKGLCSREDTSGPEGISTVHLDQQGRAAAYYQLGTVPGQYEVMASGTIAGESVLFSPRAFFSFAFDVRACIHRLGSEWYECNFGKIYYPTHTDLDFLGDWDVGGWLGAFGEIFWTGDVKKEAIDKRLMIFTHEYPMEGDHTATAHLEDPQGEEEKQEITIAAVDTALVIDSGDKQVGWPGEQLADSLVVRLVKPGTCREVFTPSCVPLQHSDKFPVTFTAIEGGGRLVQYGSLVGRTKTVLTTESIAFIRYIPGPGVNKVQARVGKNDPVVFEEVGVDVKIVAPQEEEFITEPADFLFDVYPAFDEVDELGMTYELEYAIIGGDGRGRLEPPTGTLDPLFMPVREGDITLQVSYTVTTDTQSVTNADFVTFSTVDGVEITEVRISGFIIRSIDGDTVKANPEAATFVTEEPMGEPVWIEADATTGSRNMDDQVIWTMIDNPDDAISSGTPIPATSPQAGGTMTYTFNSPTVPIPAPTGRGGPLSYQIMASIISGQEFNDKIIITQDHKDQLRQQYIDLDYNYYEGMPNRNVLSQNIGNATWPNSELRDSTSPGGYGWFQNNILTVITNLRNDYNHPLTCVSTNGSGYRSPSHNQDVSTATIKESSYHAYGRAADIHVPDVDQDGNNTIEKGIVEGIIDVYKETDAHIDKLEYTWGFHIEYEY